MAEVAVGGGEEAGVEPGVVRDERAPAQPRRQRPGEVGEGRGGEDVGGADAVDLLRAEVALGVDQGGPGVLDLAAGGEEDDADLDDAVVPDGRRPVVSRSTTA